VRERWREGGEEREGRSKREREISFVLTLEVNKIQGIIVSLYDIYIYIHIHIYIYIYLCIYIMSIHTHTHTNTHTEGR